MALRRGVGIVVFLVLFACLLSFGGLLAVWLMLGREPSVPSALDARPAHRRRPGRGRPGRWVRAVPAGQPPADGQSDRREPAQGEGGPRVAALVFRPDRADVALPGEGAGNARRDPRLPPLGQAGHRVPGGRRPDASTTSPPRATDLPGALEPAGPHRHRDLRALPARHARQDRRLPRHAAHRRVQDGRQPADREDVHACAPRDGASRSTATRTSNWCGRSPTAGGRPRTRCAR